MNIKEAKEIVIQACKDKIKKMKKNWWAYWDYKKYTKELESVIHVLENRANIEC